MKERRVEEIRGLMEKVNDRWIKNHPEPGNSFWIQAAYMLGNMAAYEQLHKQEYLEYALRWARTNQWSFYKDPDHRTVNADCMLCGETYLDLLERCGQEGTAEEMYKTIRWTLEDPANDYWWWIDSFYMALNFYNRIGLSMQEEKCIDKAFKMYWNTKVERKCFDETEGLWYRDERFLPEKMEGGRKVFWSRGNGWVFAGLARTLRTLGPDCPYYEEYRKTFLRMAEALKACQCEDGFYHTDLKRPEDFPMPESSGTALFTLGFYIGLNLGLLEESYQETADKGFEALTEVALDAKGRLGWAQIVACAPGPVKKENSIDYAVGTYLLVCREKIVWMERSGSGKGGRLHEEAVIGQNQE